MGISRITARVAQPTLQCAVTSTHYEGYVRQHEDRAQRWHSSVWQRPTRPRTRPRPTSPKTQPIGTRPTSQHIVVGLVSNAVDAAQLALQILPAAASLRIEDRHLRLHRLPAPNASASSVAATSASTTSPSTATATPTTTYVRVSVVNDLCVCVRPLCFSRYLSLPSLCPFPRCVQKHVHSYPFSFDVLSFACTCIIYIRVRVICLCVCVCECVCRCVSLSLSLCLCACMCACVGNIYIYMHVSQHSFAYADE